MRKRRSSSESEAVRVRQWHRRRGNNGEAVTDNEIANSLVIHERLIEIEDRILSKRLLIRRLMNWPTHTGRGSFGSDY